MHLNPDLKKYFTYSGDLFDQMMALRGQCFRSQKGRYTYRMNLGDKTYFIKQHFGVGWREIVKNLLQLRMPVLGAGNEWQAIERLQSLSVLTPTIVGYGSRGWNPARMRSFVLMEALSDVVSLEDYCRDWRSKPPAFSLKQALIQAVAQIARTLHENGVNHRDFYICHFLLKLPMDPAAIQLYLIDLHRAQIRKQIPLRWTIKDLSGLYFSSKEIGLTSRDLLRFMKIYSNKPLRDIFRQERNFWEKVIERGEKLYRKHQK